MMTKLAFPDSAARIAALTDHDRTLLVEAGAGSGKTALMAGRVALLVASGIHPKEIVAITFSEVAAAELLERIEGFVQSLRDGKVPVELKEGLPQGLTDEQKAALKRGGAVLDEITCTTIHGFCQQLIRPYPVETVLDPGARIIDPAAAELAYQDLLEAWLSARFGRDRGANGLGRIPPVREAGGEEDFFVELLMKAPDATLKLIKNTAQFLKTHRTARAVEGAFDPAVLAHLVETVDAFASWYSHCGVPEPITGEIVEDISRVADMVRKATEGELTGRRIAELLFHDRPKACYTDWVRAKKNKSEFRQWRARTRWTGAAKAVGVSVAKGEQLSAAGEARYLACAEAYSMFCSGLVDLALHRFVAEFDRLHDLYREYKRDAALLDFDDLLHHARDLLKGNEPVRAALVARYPRILVDEFQDTDPLQAEILWRIAGDGDPAGPWHEFAIRPGALFLVGDPKQAIYRFRGADVQTYLLAKRALSNNPGATILEITANFRSQEPILQYVNEQFKAILAETEGQPGFAALSPIRKASHEPCVATFKIVLGDNVGVDIMRREEASVVADMARGLIGKHPVWDKQNKKFRPARASDIALLAPTGTSLWIYEQALERQEIPIVTQAGKGFFRRQEVQDLIAIARAIADYRDTLAFGALIRGPLVGLTEEQIADEIVGLQAAEEEESGLYLWTDPERIENPVLRDTLTVLQNLARKARRTTPYLLLAGAIDELNVRPILKARHPHGAERVLANIDLALHMARAYAARGIADFARAMWQRWKEERSKQAEGSPDAANDAVSIITMHSAKGLEWPIVIPINSMTKPEEHKSPLPLYRHRDDSVRFKIFGYEGHDYKTVREEEKEELRRERIRLWYVALTRARDLLLLPRQTERKRGDWFSLIDIDIGSLPVLDTRQSEKSRLAEAAGSRNGQDAAKWRQEAEMITGNQRVITWHRPSRHEELLQTADQAEKVFAGTEAILEEIPQPAAATQVRGSRERGSILHKLMEEVLTGETAEYAQALQTRAAELMGQLALDDTADTGEGPCSTEMAETIERTLQLPVVAEIRPRLLPEFHIYAGAVENTAACLTAGIADAVAVDETGRIDTVIDWKSDVAPGQTLIEQYRDQLRDYLRATAAQRGLLVFLSSGHIEEVVVS